MSYVPSIPWPRISIVICVYNGKSTIARCVESIAAIDYPDFETIVVDDGSTDGTREYLRETRSERICVIELPENRGLSAARNVGMREATGEIVAYLDSDAFATPSWLRELARAFLSSSHMAIGGPNLNPPDAGFVASCVDLAPGSPTHVILDDDTIDHLPGCNLAVRRPFLEAVGGFDETFQVAGDDVDLCWRVLAFGGTLGFAPEAIVYHCRRDTVAGFLKQQRGYGRSEALLRRKWPGKFNWLGHVGVYGTMYGLYSPSVGTLLDLPLLPEWYLLIFASAWVAVAYRPARWALGGELALTTLFALTRASTRRGAATYALTVVLHVLQPLARLRGRMEYGLTPWSALFPPKTGK